jgi:primosomal protein N' (replication factor Y)
MARHLTGGTRPPWLAELDISGSVAAFIPRVRGRWRWNVVLRGSDPVELIREMPLPRGWAVDVDPASLL